MVAQSTRLLSMVSANLLGIVPNKLDHGFGVGGYYYGDSEREEE